jgi:tetratricopeptide (TPR) repeat protein
LTVWVIHGSVDWFWEVPALAGPALGFLAIAGAIRPSPAVVPEPSRPAPVPRRRERAAALIAAGIAGLAVLTVVLALPYLSVIEQSRASRERASNPVRALADLATAAKLNPLSAAPSRAAGDIALETGQYEVALARFRQSIAREPAGWFGWLGAGLAASELGEVSRARHDFEVARSINNRQPAVTTALARVDTSHPLPATQALQMLVVVQ